MKHLIFILSLGLSICSAVAEIPTEVDVLVVGGTVGGVSAAVSAKKASANVYLVAPRPYLGEDIAGCLDLFEPERARTKKGELEKLPPICKEIYSDKGHEGAALYGDTTPAQVKRTLDRALLRAHVPFLTWTIGCEILKDADGRASGVLIANRSGTRVIRAKAVVDATVRGELVRRANGDPDPVTPGDYTFTRYIVSGNAPTSTVVRTEALGTPAEIPAGSRGPHQAETQPRTIAAQLYRCDLTLPLKDGSARSFAAAEQLARDLTWTTTQLDSADTLVFKAVPRPVAKVPGAFTVGGAQAAVAERNGRAVGAEAAAFACARGTCPQPVLPTNDLPVLATCDVFVAGAGTAGAPAAIASARAGARTIVADYLPRMGGTMTDGLIGLYCYGLKIGFTAELDGAVYDFGAIYGQCKAEWLRAEARKAGAEIWFGTVICGVRKNDAGALTAVEVAFSDGTHGLVQVKTAIDATGNADLAAFAGEETEFVNAEELSLQGAGSTPKILGTSYQNTDYAFVDDSDVEDLCYFTLRARQSFGTYVWDQSQNVNSRERRRLHGVTYITAQDIMNARTYPDVISHARSNFDTHGQTVADEFFIEAPHAKEALVVNIPLRALLPKQTDGLLVTGLGMSAHRDAMPVIRMQPDVQNQGYAAGLAAAQAVKDGVAVRAVDITKLQQALVKKGIVKPSVIGMKDSFPLPDAEIVAAVKTLGNDYEGLSKVLSDPVRALPHLRAAFAEATEPKVQLIYAHVLGLLGDATGALVLDNTLARAVKWDDGWNYKGMDQFGRSVSWMDSYVIALGRTKSKDAFDRFAALADLLRPNSHYSHFRALALGFESLGDPRGAEVLAKVLALKSVAGHAFAPGDLPKVKGYETFVTRNLGLGDKERSDCLRELCVARALYNLGDKDGQGAAVLKAYAQDPRKAYANHAQKVLAQPPAAQFRRANPN